MYRRIHSLDIIIVLYQNSQNEVVYEQVQDTQHDTTDLKVCCYHDNNVDCIIMYIECGV